MTVPRMYNWTTVYGPTLDHILLVLLHMYVCRPMYSVSRRCLHIEAISQQNEARSRAYAPLLFRMTSRVLHSAQYHRKYCTLKAFEQFGALYMHDHDDQWLQAPVDTNEPSGLASITSTCPRLRFQVNTRRSPNVDSTLGDRLQRWSNNCASQQNKMFTQC